MNRPDSAAFKRAAATRALDYVENGMKLGLGTGTTAEAFVELLAEKVARGLRVTCTATSRRTAEKAAALGIALADLDALAPLDLAVDGADEADRNLDLIKGGGGALLREKIVEASAKRLVIIADESKLVDWLGRFPLSVEVIPFGHVTTAARIQDVARALGYAHLAPKLRAAVGAPFITDSGNYIYDCPFGAIADAHRLANALANIAGVVEHGLFVGMASALVIAGTNGIQVIEPKPHPSTGSG
jgi:ribose 5-phosphate isomerase A